MQDSQRVTRNQIKATAKFFPSLYSVAEYDHGFEVIRHVSRGYAGVFFRNDGITFRTDIHSPRIGVREGARVLGMLDCHWGE